MQMGFGLYQQQTLKLVMTPELRQAITILQYSAVDLLEFLRQQVTENPILDMSERHRELTTTDIAIEKKKNNHDDIDWKDYARANATGDETYYQKSMGTAQDYDPFNFISAGGTTLEENLLEQVAMLKDVTPVEKRILNFLIGNLNESGYLTISEAEAADILNTNVEKIEEMISLLQTLEPVGIGARSLAECLLLQLKAKPEENTLAMAIVEHHLEDLAEKRYQKIASSLKVTPQEVQQAADYLRTLNPRPGAEFAQGTPRYIVPDVTVEKVEDEYVVMVNESSTPNLTINRFYQRMLQKDEVDTVQRYIQDKLNSALWLIRSIEQRRMTLYKVTQAIVEEQRDFFEKGPSGLKPMTLRDIAEKVGLHESTISRATSNKYVQTPRGLFELKYFFTTGLNRVDGGAASSVLSIKEKIKALIDAEDKKKPLSDQKITDILVKEGIEISRRTVAKYREEMNIDSSSKRKRF
ncbi:MULTISPECIES: RNA polymerase factor sigma-54 [Aneurinibacillus]|uniref:RNA polymerase factor sigma-54 n=1 Tax=Aneurinibacillus thermoaerophilus TaxID=143495 RepID=A0A1G8EQW6_ANETH|nr:MULTISPECIES: RNA polymerase factor sigma-54 [Aneurinibacillus]AMA71795.1 RNA polymerase sigma-54 factor [Aneurinibacillus sp. XH2]MED0677364.1 RNA polymerase factor sigma-54 [Aneurinibacillus thermoaerophilus]MED0677725.1 RNA polymerase factor sigma-54 [Aneurinibacillus thermoaerophilus]MED0737030.1 RNA polymerase factor sigma-54 [Aneurinibacillus thermoaerophilus]MED0755860.1 RNA polymerase factor sigma-54 [Aneurinibacillus thermoaerophilus]